MRYPYVLSNNKADEAGQLNKAMDKCSGGLPFEATRYHGRL